MTTTSPLEVADLCRILDRSLTPEDLHLSWEVLGIDSLDLTLLLLAVEDAGFDLNDDLVSSFECLDDVLHVVRTLASHGGPSSPNGKAHR
jgi:hypothetical protein